MTFLCGFKRAGLLLSVLFIFHAAHARENYVPGYIINNSNDTLVGLVDFRDWKKNPDRFSFKPNEKSVHLDFTITEVKEFGVEDNVYVRAVVDMETTPVQLDRLDSNPQLKMISDTVFLQVLFRGEKNLYLYNNQQGKENYYIKSDSGYDLLVYKKYFEEQKGKRVVAENNKYLGQLVLYLDDCENIQPMLQKTTYSQKRLSKLFQHYYKCTAFVPHFQKQPDRIKTETGILTGASVTTLDFRGAGQEVLVNAAYAPSMNFSAGLFFDIIFPGNQEKWSVYNELLYSSFSVEDVSMDFKHEDLYTVTTTEFDYAHLKLNNMIRFRYPAGLFTLFLNGGVTNGFAVSETNYKRTESKLYTENRIKEGRALDDTRKYEQGYLAGTGAKFSRLSIEFRFERGGGMSEYTSLESAVKRYFLLIGYRF